MAFDGSPDIHLVTKGQVALADLGQPLNLWRRQDPLTLEREDRTPSGDLPLSQFHRQKRCLKMRLGSGLFCSLVRFDWSFCLEVAEHLPSTLTPTFLANLDKILGLHLVVADCVDFSMIQTSLQFAQPKPSEKPNGYQIPDPRSFKKGASMTFYDKSSSLEPYKFHAGN